MSPVPSHFAKACLEAEDGERIECWLNPTSLRTSRKARFDCRGSIGQSVETLSYLGGNAEALSVALVLHAEDGRSGEDVVSTIGRLHGLLEPDEDISGRQQSRPRTVQLMWGQFTSFIAICSSVDVNVELFDSDGTPLRALVDLTLTQFEPEPDQRTGTSQNPTTRALARRRLHTIVHGETLAGISYSHLGDPTRWREIAEANDIDDPLKLVPGAQLAIPLGAP